MASALVSYGLKEGKALVHACHANRALGSRLPKHYGCLKEHVLLQGALWRQRSRHRDCIEPGRSLSARQALAWCTFAMAASTSRLMAFWNHPAGPKTIHFWAPTFKWGITLANVADFWRPADKISYPQQTAVTATGLIWSRFSTQITPVRLSVQHFVTFLLRVRVLSRLPACCM